jgi:hypothetical protein
VIEGDWRLVYSGAGHLPAADFTFGTGGTGYMLLGEPDVADADLDVGDQSLPGEDGVRMGRDYSGGMTITFELGIDTVDYPASPAYSGPGVFYGDGQSDIYRGQWSREAYSYLRGVWRADALRRRAGAVAYLQTRRNGATRAVYGRPRKIAPAPRLYRQGWMGAVMDFQTVDERWYDATTKSVEINQRRRLPSRAIPGKPTPGSPGSPGKWGPGSGQMDLGSSTVLTPARGSMKVRGDRPTWPVVTFNGPMRNVHCWIGDQVNFALWDYPIPAGHWVKVDPRPWARTVLTDTGASVAHKLTRASSRLAEMFVPPGSYSFGANYSGTTSTNSVQASVVVEWHDAYGWM